MVKLMVLFFILSVTYISIAQDGGEDYITGQVGEWTIYSGCQNADLGKCGRNRICCFPNVCWIDGLCDKKVPSGISTDGLPYVSGKVGEWRRYDACEEDLGRIGDSCSKESDCCFPLECTSGKCVTISGLAQVAAALRGFGRA